MNEDELLDLLACVNEIEREPVKLRDALHIACNSLNSEVCPDTEIEFTAIHCPNCPDQGWYATETAKQEWTQVQCQFCHSNPNSVFNIKAANEQPAT